MKKVDVWLSILSVLFLINLVVVVILAFNSNVLLQPVQTQSEVTIGEFYSIDGQVRFADGIVFEDVNSAPLVDNPAQNNDAGVAGGTAYGIDILESSTPLEICAKADRVLTNDGNSVELGVLADESYASDLDAQAPSTAGQVSFTTNDVLMPGGPVNAGETLFMRFWLDVNENPETGTYTNTITFTAQPEGSGNAC